MPSKTMYSRLCMACGKQHETHKPKAKRCQPCIDAGHKAKTQTCPSCDDPFPAIHGGTFCRSCQGDPEKLEDYQQRKSDMLMELMQRDIEEDKEERKLRAAKRRRDEAQRQLAELERLSAKPKGYPAMNKKTAESALGVMWLNICATDGNVKSLLKDRQVDDDTKHRMLTTYLRLRLKGFTTDALAKVDPTHLMAQDVAQVDQAIRELPPVEGEEDDEEEDFTFDPYEDLDPETRHEVIAFTENQERHQTAQRLGLTAAAATPQAT